MQNLDEVTQVFTQVAYKLPTGGDFLFDALSLYTMELVFPGYM